MPPRRSFRNVLLVPSPGINPPTGLFTHRQAGGIVFACALL